LHATAQDALYIGEGSIVYIEYRLELADGTLVYDNVGKDPFVYEAGGNKILQALDEALRGRRAGDRRVVRLAARDGFGGIDDRLLVEVPLLRLPEDARTAGAVVLAENPRGRKQRAVVREVKDHTAVLDYNHPLAGKDLVYFVKIVDVK
jgi:FKBP-type peptidyl-prolyl cis-trans isomerase 2